MDNIRKWLILTSLGVLENIKDCASLMLGVVNLDSSLSEKELESTETALISFGMGLVTHLIDSDLLMLVNDSDEIEMDSRATRDFIDMLQGLKEED